MQNSIIRYDLIEIRKDLIRIAKEEDESNNSMDLNLKESEKNVTDK
jgi:hypothetical protein